MSRPLSPFTQGDGKIRIANEIYETYRDAFRRCRYQRDIRLSDDPVYLDPQLCIYFALRDSGLSLPVRTLILHLHQQVEALESQIAHLQCATSQLQLDTRIYKKIAKKLYLEQETKYDSDESK